MTVRDVAASGTADVIGMIRGMLRADPKLLREHCCEAVMAVVGAAVGGFFEWGVVGGHPVRTRQRLVGASQWAFAPEADPRCPDPRANGRFVARGAEIHFTL